MVNNRQFFVNWMRGFWEIPQIKGFSGKSHVLMSHNLYFEKFSWKFLNNSLNNLNFKFNETKEY
jgi:hypothetical protein